MMILIGLTLWLLLSFPARLVPGRLATVRGEVLLRGEVIASLVGIGMKADVVISMRRLPDVDRTRLAAFLLVAMTLLLGGLELCALFVRGVVGPEASARPSLLERRSEVCCCLSRRDVFAVL